MKKYLIILVFSFFLILPVYASHCDDYTNSGLCNNDTQCIWNASSSTCETLPETELIADSFDQIIKQQNYIIYMMIFLMTLFVIDFMRRFII